MKLKNLIHRIPRPVRACICVFLAVVLAVSYYVMLDCPVLTMKQQFRRAEKVHLVGPSKIVDVLEEEEYGEFVRMYVGESENGISFFGLYHNNHPYNNPFDEKEYYFHYTEKASDMTLCAVPNVWGPSWEFFGFEQALPVYLFTENSEAVRAELEMTVKGSSQKKAGEQLTAHFPASTELTGEGFFRFYLKADKEQSLEALYFLSSAISGNAMHGICCKENVTKISAVIRLYNADGKLIAVENRTLYSA